MIRLRMSWMRVALDDFGENEVSRIYLAGEPAEAKRVEEILSVHGVEYAVEVERYVRSSFFTSEHAGAAFYVLSRQAGCCRKLLLEAGLKTGILDESE